MRARWLAPVTIEKINWLLAKAYPIIGMCRSRRSVFNSSDPSPARTGNKQRRLSGISSDEVVHQCFRLSFNGPPSHS
jgi:hypothetical protein